MRGKRSRGKLMLICLLLFFLSRPVDGAGPEIGGATAVLINGRTGEILWEKDAYQQMHPASTTKILTAILLLENTSPDEVATASRRAVQAPGSSLYLTEGQAIFAKDLLYALMLHSANDAAVVAAEHVAGSAEAFAAMMNAKALQAGAMHSNFVNPHGLTDNNHLTTAYDLAMITRYAMLNSMFMQAASARRHVIDWPGGERLILNKNQLLASYDGALGVKTGYTVRAKRTIVAAAERDGLLLIAVVLGASGSGVWKDAASLLDYGFDRFSSVRPIRKGEDVDVMPVRFGGKALLVAAEDFEITQRDANADISFETVIDKPLKAPLTRGQKVGEILVICDGLTVGSVAVVTADHVPRVLLATGRFWLLSVFLGVAGLWVRKLYRRRRRKKMLLIKRNYGYPSRNH